MKSKKNVVVGLGEIGNPLYKIISKATLCVGFDIDKNLMNQSKFQRYLKNETSFLHICIPYNNTFEKNVIKLTKKFEPEYIVIHSTVKPYTSEKLQKCFSIPIIYSPVRGVHKRMIYDLKRYSKFFAVDKKQKLSSKASSEYRKLFKKLKIKTKKVSSTITLELSKIICDTSYYGWLINYAQLSNMIAINHQVDYDEMWSFSDEIHKYLKNRPKLYPGVIGGHCVIPNLDLIHNQSLDLIKNIDKKYRNKIKKNNT
tara:strand:- start:2101 stop:2868 length:768 start_codon:yes stop_codon:yes gene_type:complete